MKTAEELTLENGKSPTAKEIAEKLGVPEEEVLSCMEAGSVVSLDRPADGEDGEDGASFYDVLPAFTTCSPQARTPSSASNKTTPSAARSPF